MSDRPARVVRELAAILAAHAVGIVALSYCHHFTPAPTRQLWFILEFVTAFLLWLPARFAPAHMRVRPRDPAARLDAGAHWPGVPNMREQSYCFIT